MVEHKNESDLESSVNGEKTSRKNIPDTEYDRHEKNNDTDTGNRMDHQSTDDDNADTSQGYGGSHNNEYKR